MYLLFNNLTFKNGINLTVRRGVKWDLMRGRDVQIGETGKTKLSGKARILDTKVLPANMILETEDQLHLEYDSSCRTKEGLLDELERVYPGFRSCEIVTLVYFEIL